MAGRNEETGNNAAEEQQRPGAFKARLETWHRECAKSAGLLSGGISTGKITYRTVHAISAMLRGVTRDMDEFVAFQTAKEQLENQQPAKERVQTAMGATRVQPKQERVKPKRR
jgi:hypothetical protein